MAATAEDTSSRMLVPHAGSRPIELARLAWLHAKRGRSDSAKTEAAYRATLDSFRAMLAAAGVDLDGDIQTVALLAQGWAAQPRARDGRPVAAATVNQRLAVLSSFYAFARQRGLLAGENPIERVERRPVQSYAGAQPLDAATVAERLAAIDRSPGSGELAGKRDYALLALAFQTGRRLAELAALRWGDVQMSGGRATVTWRRCKGGKVMHDTLPDAVTGALLAWLHAAYGAQLGPALAPDAPVWRSLARNTSRGHALGVQSIADVCEKRLGTSKVHTTRHTFAHAMEHVGAKVSDIQARLGHSSLDTTGRYLAALRSAENTHGDDLAVLFGVAPAPRPPDGRRRAKTARPRADQRHKGA